MWGAENFGPWVVAHVKALLPDDWISTAGELFREGMQVISQFVLKNGLVPDDLVEKGIDRVGRKLDGLASKEDAEAKQKYAEAAKGFAEEEEKRIAAELNRRALEPDVRKREAEAQKAEAEAVKARAEARKASADAELATIQVVKETIGLVKEVGTDPDLFRKLEAAGMVLLAKDDGNFVVLPMSKDSLSLLPANPGNQDGK